MTTKTPPKFEATVKGQWTEEHSRRFYMTAAAIAENVIQRKQKSERSQSEQVVVQE